MNAVGHFRSRQRFSALKWAKWPKSSTFACYPPAISTDSNYSNFVCHIIILHEIIMHEIKFLHGSRRLLLAVVSNISGTFFFQFIIFKRKVGGGLCKRKKRHF